MAKKPAGDVLRRAHRYRRVSSGPQMKEKTAGDVEIGRGLERQEEDAAALCARMGWFLVEDEDFDDFGKSGFHRENLGPNGGLTRFLDKIKARLIKPGEVLVIEHLDRLSRADARTAFRLFNDILDAGIWIATVVPERVYKKENAGLTDLIEPIVSMVGNHDESVKKSVRATRHWREIHAAIEEGGRHGRETPAWIAESEEGYVLDPLKSSVVRRIVELALEGMGAPRIEAWIAGHPEDFPPLEERHPWTVSSIGHLLNKPAIAGYYQRESGRPRRPVGDPMPGYYPAVITEDEWARLKAAIASRRHAYGRVSQEISNLFTRLVFVGKKRAPVQSRGRTAAGSVKRYLHARGPNHERIEFKYAAFERAVLGAIAILKPADVLPAGEEGSAADERIKELSDRRSAIEQRLAENNELLADPECRSASKVIAASIVRLESDLQSLDDELEPLRWERQSSVSDDLETVQNLIELLERAETRGNVAEVRSRLRGAIPSVVKRINLVIQWLPNRRLFGHIMIHFRSGEPRYLQVEPDSGVPPGVEIADLADPDNKSWGIGYVAANAPPA
jgi:DNA invertase Pin-like site-specific DNA recombinase